MTSPDEFRWNEWNLGHAKKHGITIAEIESILRNARRPYPQYIGDGKWRVYGRGTGGRLVEVIFVDDQGEPTVYVIHAMQVTTRRRRRGG